MSEPTGERFIPEAMGGELIEAEHHARYRFAAQQVSDRQVLDAGCGVGWGTALLLDAGARSAIGVDVAGDAVADANARSARGRFVVADLQALPFVDSSFDFVTCFEAIEHVSNPSRALDELTRVLSDDGILLVSSPNPHVYPPGNPFHVHEFTPEALHEELASRFTSTALWRQYDLSASVLVDGRPMSPGQPIATITRSVIQLPSDHDIYSVVTATSGKMLPFGAIVMVAPQTALRYMTSAYEAAVHEIEAVRHDRERVEALLSSAEEQLEGERETMATAIAELQQQLHDIRASTSWRATGWFRKISGIVRRGGEPPAPRS